MKWEYDYLYPVDRIEKLDDIIATMKLMGQDGWELVSVDNGIAYFKRAISRDMSEFKSGMVWRTMIPEETADRDAKNKEKDQNELSRK